MNDHYYPVCPVCDEEYETIYVDGFGKVVGCDKCIDAWEEEGDMT